MGTREDYEGLAAAAGFVPLRYDDISRQVRRTWSICAGRAARRLATDRAFRRFAFARTTKNRSFLLSVPRLMVALKTGSMRYGVFAWGSKPGAFARNSTRPRPADRLAEEKDEAAGDAQRAVCH